jgi:hypothetical protein
MCHSARRCVTQCIESVILLVIILFRIMVILVSVILVVVILLSAVAPLLLSHAKSFGFQSQTILP